MFNVKVNQKYQLFRLKELYIHKWYLRITYSGFQKCI